ncbi:hypothetical protein TNCV_349201 [Trichonephila clavipes]|nr:hypothetical protein TNCV_349201 [Trichonephila clavipes]
MAVNHNDLLKKHSRCTSYPLFCCVTHVGHELLLWSASLLLGRHTQEDNSSAKVTGRLIDPLYSVEGTMVYLIAVATAYCLKESVEFDQDEGCQMQSCSFHKSENSW